MNKVLKWVLGIVSFVIVASIIGVVIFVSQFDLNEYKPKIEQLVFQQTGRKLKLEGDISLKISFVPTVALKNASFENAPWAKKKNMITIKEADVSLAILPLLNKEIEIGEINLINPEIYLAVNENGEGNWIFQKPEEKEVEENAAQQEKSEEINAAAAPLIAGFFAEKIDIKNGVVHYNDARSKSEFKLLINNFELQAEDENDDVDLVYDIVFNGQSIKGLATSDSLNALIQNRPYHIALDAKAFGVTSKAKVVLNNMFEDLGYEVNINALSPNGNFNLPVMQLDAYVIGNMNTLNATIKKLDIASSVITGDLAVDISGKKPSVNANLRSGLIDIRKFNKQSKSAKLELISTAHAAAFVPDEKLDLSAMKNINLKALFDVKELIVNEDITLNSVMGTINIKNAVLTVNPLSLFAGGGKVEGSVSLDAKGNVLDVALDGKNIVVQDFIKSLQPSNTSTFGFLSGGETSLSVHLNTKGETYQTMVENLDGQILLAVGESRIQAGAMKYLKGNFISQLLSALKLQTKDPKMSLKCAVLRADMKEGMASFPKGIVFDSKKMMVVADGTLNLKNDKLDMAIKPFNGNLTDTNIAQALSSLIKISGTVMKPSIAIDTASVVKNVVGVAMTGPVFLGSQLLLDADSAPCYTALKDTSFSDMFEAPKGVKAGAQNVYQGTSDAVSSGINAVTGTAGNVVQGGANIIGGTAKGVFNLLTGSTQKKKE